MTDQRTVEMWVGFMREHGLRRLSVNGIEVELGGVPHTHSKAMEPMAQQGVFEDATGSVCACGHNMAVEHSPVGCLFGCSHDLCSSFAGASDVG